MSIEHGLKIANELEIRQQQVEAVSLLLDDGATVPFIARYRKEATGSLDEVAIIKIRDRLEQLRDLDKRRESILESLKERELLTEELEEKIKKAGTMSELEDIYLPFKPKRRTRATMAREKGLEPLADILWEQLAETDPVIEAEKYIDREKGVESIDDALSGARDIIAEKISEDQNAREAMRAYFMRKSLFQAKIIKGKEQEGSKYKDYFDWSEPAKTAPSHRVLAMRRGEKEGFITMKINPPQDEAFKILEDKFVNDDSPASLQVLEAAHECYKRLLSLSMETEIRLETKKRADEKAISVFSSNLRELLLAPFLGQKRVLAIDPGIRTGCKAVCLDPQGKLLYYETIYPFGSADALQSAKKSVRELCSKYSIEAIAIGNGTAGRETETFVRELGLQTDIIVSMVNESGASVYSASEVARDEFPDLDISYRGSVSIGRRLMDPLAELVKIDPKSIGVGQYQHDVNQQALKEGLDDVVISCVNGVGVEVNTASEQLLAYVSGLGPQLAKNIVKYRDENGALSKRDDLKNVPRLGPKAFEQAAGFLRIRGGVNPLDASAVHPETYHIVEAMASDMGCSIEDLIKDEEIRKKIDLNRYVASIIGMPTLNDIMDELSKPGRDPRKQFEQFEFAEGVEKIDDIKSGMKLPGIITNVTAFGAFVDIGVHQDGLVHVSQLADHFVKDPHKEAKVNQKVKVTVLDVDLERKRISLSMKKNPEENYKRDHQKKKTVPRNKPEKKSMKKKPEPFNNPFKKLL
ncbi:Tex family protein [Thermodesulfobacteriota bacterium]